MRFLGSVLATAFLLVVNPLLKKVHADNSYFSDIFSAAFDTAGGVENHVHVKAGDGSGNFYSSGATRNSIGSGAFTASNIGGLDWFVVKWSAQGSIQWMRLLQTPQDDHAYAIDSDVFGNIYVGGSSSGYLGNLVPLSGNSQDSIVAKYDANGNRLWISNSMASANTDDNVQTLVVSGNYLYVLGNFRTTTNQGWDVYIKKLSLDGTTVWSSTWGGSSDDYVNAAAVDVNGFLYFSGSTYSSFPRSFAADNSPINGFNNLGGSDGYLTAYDNNGYKLYNLQIATPNDDSMYAITLDGSGGVYVAGKASGPVNQQSYTGSDSNAVILKYVSGQLVWTREFGPQQYSVHAIRSDGVGALYFAQEQHDSPGPWHSAYNPSGTMLSKMDFNGNIIWQQNVPGQVGTLDFDNNGVLSAAGTFTGSYAGVSTQWSNWDSFLYATKVSYNCSCDELSSLVDQVQQLLDTTPF